MASVDVALASVDPEEGAAAEAPEAEAEAGGIVEEVLVGVVGVGVEVTGAVEGVEFEDAGADAYFANTTLRSSSLRSDYIQEQPRTRVFSNSFGFGFGCSFGRDGNMKRIGGMADMNAYWKGGSNAPSDKPS